MKETDKIPEIREISVAIYRWGLLENLRILQSQLELVEAEAKRLEEALEIGLVVHCFKTEDRMGIRTTERKPMGFSETTEEFILAEGETAVSLKTYREMIEERRAACVNRVSATESELDALADAIKSGFIIRCYEEDDCRTMKIEEKKPIGFLSR